MEHDYACTSPDQLTILALNLQIPLNLLQPNLELLRKQPCKAHRARIVFADHSARLQAELRIMISTVFLSPRQHLRIKFAAITAGIHSNTSISEERLDLGHPSTIDSVPLLKC